MRKVILSIALLGVTGFALCYAIRYIARDRTVSPSPVMSLSNTEADTETREYVRGIEPADVAYIRLVGSGTSHIPEKRVPIHDPILIREFVLSIRKAVKPIGESNVLPGLRSDVLETYLKDRSLSRLPRSQNDPCDIRVLFFADSSPYTIGPDFQRALRRAGIGYGQKPYRPTPFSFLGIGADESER